MPKLAKLGILAGGGELPRLLIKACQKTNRPVFVIAFLDQCDEETVQGVDHAWVRMGKAGKSIKLLHANNVEQLVMAGKIKKPSLLQLMPDAKALKVIANGVINQGDDGLLRAIIKDLENNEGFPFVGVHEVLPELLTPEGVLGAVQPNTEDVLSIKFATQTALDLGAKDKGQAAITSATEIIALEDRSGTDALIKGLFNDPRAKGCVLAKMCKPDQEKRADLPTIGLKTIENAEQAGLSGIVVEAQASLILDRDCVIKAADQAGLFLVGVRA
ncbi:MAG: UDP-2,3-diacylglucosamine pyrophosphatase [Rhodospirillaceae bacterium]|nr:MAG: UDP-2,3-diacylglucosamine pyrophosphatase [Rhodospirillaceae bacterium]